MSTITAANYDQDKYRTPIEQPSDNQLVGNVTITLKEPPIGQPNFVVNDNVIVYRVHDGGMQKIRGIVKTVYGPSKYKVELA
ncbi:hypothetical protein [Pseudoalteromonas umbrosa]|uniref:hypothetical protein n=1 Tax=Pseudoalteromonas umbrosa TaxID=3048489 RepID=UPI0024C24FD5|nr:hypothetical protein [Pseudoalteromonas sp. B95]MDK1285740.1 hypothetical protein [Pseudoalteromonas sp. B95]